MIALFGALLEFFIVPSDAFTSFAEGYQKGVQVGVYFFVVSYLAIPVLILFKKNKLKNFGLLLIALLSGLGAIFLSALSGLIPVACLTTIKAEE